MILITGGARRVGRAVAIGLARHGWDVAFTYHHGADEAASLLKELDEAGVQGMAIQADLTARTGIEAVTTALSAHAPLTALLNNASIYEPDRPADPDQPARMWRIHVETPLLLARALAPQLKATRGTILNMCDILGERPMRGWLAYCASKAALANLTLGLARELAPEVRVNGIAPGVVEWPADYPEEQKAQYLRRVPLGRAGTPEDVAQLVHFLLSEGAYITGQILRLDGGRSIA